MLLSVIITILTLSNTLLLSHFSSFLEVITGVYISMCMDNILKGVWSPKYYDDLKSALTEYYLKDHDDFIDRIVGTNTQKAESINHFMKNRAVFFFVICLILLLLSGFENTNSLVGNSFQMSLFFVATWTLILLFLNRYFFSTIQHTALAIILLVILSFISYNLNIRYANWIVSNDIVVIFVLVVLIAPILWQTFVCWMFSSAYRGYIRSKLEEGKLNYEKAEKGLAEHNPEIIPNRYKDIYTNLSIKSENAEEAKGKCLDQYLELMESEIAEASDPKSAFKIFVSWISFHLRFFLKNIAISLKFKKRKTISQE